MEWKFLEDQRSTRKMVCEDFVDRKWEKTMERRRRDVQGLDKMRVEKQINESMQQSISSLDALESDGLESETDTPSEKDFEHILDSNSECSTNINPNKPA